MYNVKLDEHRVELQDARINFMNLASPIEINFLNPNPNLKEMSWNPFGVTGFVAELSSRVII